MDKHFRKQLESALEDALQCLMNGEYHEAECVLRDFVEQNEDEFPDGLTGY